MESSVRKAVIWDMDGTLVDTAELHFQAWVKLAAEVNRPFSHADFVATFGRRNPEIIRLLFDAGLSDAQIAEWGERKEILYRHAAQEKGIDLLPGVRPLIEGLDTIGFEQAIGSSAPRHNLELILRLTKIIEHFSVLVSMEDTQRGKPDPEVFLIAAKKLGVTPNNCVVVEDAIAGVEAAKAGGMKCIGVTFVGHHSAESLAKAGADLVVKNLTEISSRSFVDLLQK